MRQTKLSIIEKVSSGQGFIIQSYVGYIWESVSFHYRSRDEGCPLGRVLLYILRSCDVSILAVIPYSKKFWWTKILANLPAFAHEIDFGLFVRDD